MDNSTITTGFHTLSLRELDPCELCHKWGWGSHFSQVPSRDSGTGICMGPVTDQLAPTATSVKKPHALNNRGLSDWRSSYNGWGALGRGAPQPWVETSTCQLQVKVQRHRFKLPKEGGNTKASDSALCACVWFNFDCKAVNLLAVGLTSHSGNIDCVSSLFFKNCTAK